MWRFYYVIIRNIFRLPQIIATMRRMAEQPDKYSETDCYQYMKYVVDLMQKTGHIRTERYGADNLPKEGGYMIYPNHQGKYDAYGIVAAHESPCTVVMDKNKSYVIFIREIIDMLRGKRMDINDTRQALTVINEITEEVAQGRRYILFPEGGYAEDQKNTLGDFKPGCFKIVLKSKVPVVPTVLIDSYKVFNSSQMGKITTQVHFLEPIYYEEYKGMKTQQIAAMVRERIREKINEVTGAAEKN